MAKTNTSFHGVEDGAKDAAPIQVRITNEDGTRDALFCSDARTARRQLRARGLSVKDFEKKVPAEGEDGPQIWTVTLPIPEPEEEPAAA